jgi:hypothetical protein
MMCNDPNDLGCQRRLHNLPALQAKARAATRRLLTMQRAGQRCVPSTTLFERVALPSLEKGHRTGALRFGEPRIMALTGALCTALNANTNRSLRAQVAGLLGVPYTASQMTYDLRRMRHKGLIRRLPHRHAYVLTDDGIRGAVFYTKVHDRMLGPLLDADCPLASPDLRSALRVIDTRATDYVNSARLGKAA